MKICECSNVNEYSIDDSLQKVFCIQCGREISAYSLAKNINQQLPKFKNTSHNETNSQYDSDKNKATSWLKSLDVTHPEQIIANDNFTVTPTESKIIGYFLNELKLSYGATNIILYYIRDMYDMTLPYGYTRKVGEAAAQKNLVTATETFKWLRQFAANHKTKI